MKKILLTQGKIALVDDADFERVNQFKWYANRTGYLLRHWYAVRGVLIGGKQRHSYMHRFILDAPNDMLIDHKNGDSLDNRRQNIRLATRTENAQNQHYITNISHLKGVYNYSGRWRGQIRVLGKLIHLGYFKTEQEAADAYDKAAIKYFGDYACTNISISGV